MPNLYTVKLDTVEDVIKDDIDINNKVVYVETHTSNYHGIGEGIMDIFSIKVEGGEYIVKDHEGREMIETDGNTIIVRQVSTNPYVQDYLQVYELNDNSNKKEEVLQVVKMLAFKGVSFGGEQPYVNTLKRVLIGLPEEEDSEADDAVEEPEPTEPEPTEPEPTEPDPEPEPTLEDDGTGTGIGSPTEEV